MPLTPALALTVLESWADLLVSAFAGCAPADACLVRLTAVPDAVVDEVDLGLLRLDGSHPCDLLHELDVGAGCLALGVAAGGWAAPLGDGGGGGPPSAHPDAERVVQVVLVGRDGTVVSRLRFPGGEVLREPPADGSVLDALRAALGVEVGPP